MRDLGVARAFMGAVVDADGTVLSASGNGSFRVTENDPGLWWGDPAFDDSSWAGATICSYVHSDWDSAGNGFRTISDPYGASRIWLGDQCAPGISGVSTVWIRMTF